MLVPKSIHRTTFFALFTLLALSIYIFLLPKPTFTLSPFAFPRPIPHRNPIVQKFYHTNALPLRLNQTQELAALTAFLASLSQNVIPLSVDPKQPIDPQLVLDFDTRSPRASEELQVMVDDVWVQNPIVLYSKFYSPASREIKALLASMNLFPEPTIFDVDLRDDSTVLTPLLLRLTHSPELPVLLIGGQYVGPLQHIRDLQVTTELQRMLTTAGAVVDGGKKKKKGRK